MDKNNKHIPIKRYRLNLRPDSRRVIARPFFAGDDARIRSLVEKLIAMPPEEITRELRRILRDFSGRHRNVTRIMDANFERALGKDAVRELFDGEVDPELRLLVGAYFTSEYSIEGSALFNPSIVEDIDQDDLEDGQTRFVMSFRAVGEGHISSIVFRSCTIDADGEFTFAPISKLVEEPEVITRYNYVKQAFLDKLSEMGVERDVIGVVMDRLGDNFIYGELRAAVEGVEESSNLTAEDHDGLQAIFWVARSHYEITFSMDTAIDDRVIFPNSYAETNGIEDARFVRFVDDDGEVTFYATYTAYNGYTILPKLLMTKDFFHFEILPINGKAAQNKGMSLFPRKVHGKYGMITRSDGINLFVSFSNDLNRWEPGKKIYGPSATWNYIQVGNSGSPIETEEGWLVITHGVGPMRSYSLGAILLDLEDPEKVIAELDEPFLIPNSEEREGYVPNVVYSCGSVIHGDRLIVPYAYSDYACNVASLSLDDLFRAMTRK
jgi:predicted GH43/DUF377 family glycosyl hydrolase